MIANLERAKDLLRQEQYTCVMCKEEKGYTSKERGVKPLLKWIEEEIDVRGFAVADKVVGKGAAFLYVLLGVKEIYALVISKAAVEVLETYHITVTYERKVEAIKNRTGTGLCPMEQGTKDIDNPAEALVAIRNILSRLG